VSPAMSRGLKPIDFAGNYWPDESPALSKTALIRRSRARVFSPRGRRRSKPGAAPQAKVARAVGAKSEAPLSYTVLREEGIDARANLTIILLDFGGGCRSERQRKRGCGIYLRRDDEWNWRWWEGKLIPPPSIVLKVRNGDPSEIRGFFAALRMTKDCGMVSSAKYEGSSLRSE
jgi:hypothetical protein